MKWALNQSPTIYKLFGECWASDPFGSRFMLLSTTLRGDNLRKAKKVIKDAGLFEFKVEMHVVAGETCYETRTYALTNETRNAVMKTRQE